MNESLFTPTRNGGGGGDGDYGIDYRLIPSLSRIFQSFKYRIKRKFLIKRIFLLLIWFYCYLLLLLIIFNTKYSYCYSYPLKNQKNSVMFLLNENNNNNNDFIINNFYNKSVGFDSQQSSSSILTSALIEMAVASSSSSSSAAALSTSTTSSTNSNSNCIPICQCKWKSGKETANCDHRSLLTIPNGLSPTTQVLDISGNVLTQLPPMIFIQRGLINLQRIYLANCHLVEISPESFLKLSNLIELDLSNNSLSTIPSRSLAECHGLRRLSLAGNRIRDVKSRSFLPLTNLNWLDLSRNVIYHLDTDAFIGLRSLKILKLQSNHLQTIPSAQSFIQFLSTKISLELHDNQWRCDCHLKPFRDWIQEFSIPIIIEPVCMMPQRLQGQTWNSIPSDQFSCPPTIHTVNSHFYKHIGNNVTIICSVSGFPPPKIYWLFESTNNLNDNDHDNNNGDIDNLNGNSNDNNNLVLDEDDNDDEENNQPILQSLKRRPYGLPSKRYSIVQEREQLGVISSKLTVHSLQPIDTQRITCLAQNVGGLIMKNFTLIVSTQEPFSSSRSMDLLVSEFMLIVVSICILLLVLMIFLFVMIFRRKSSSSSSNNNQNNGCGGGSSNGLAITTGTNQVMDSSQNPLPNQLGGAMDNGMEAEYRMLKPPLPSSINDNDDGTTTILTNGDLINHEKFNQNHHQLSSTPQYHLAQYPHHHPNGTIGVPTSNILMVNTIDMFNAAAAAAAAAAAQHGQQLQLSSDPSDPTDLSSQSTTATTSINGNGTTATTISPPPPPLVSSNNLNSNHPQLLQHCSTISANSLSPTQHPDILISSNAYYLATAATPVQQQQQQQYQHQHHSASTQFPLLNSGPLFAATTDQTNLIYGTTRIAPTRMISSIPAATPTVTTPNNQASKITKVKFADEFHQESSLDSTTTTGSSSSLSNAYTIATLRRNNQNNNNNNGNTKAIDSLGTAINRQLNIQHRSVQSYPEGLRLMESSVDSGEPIHSGRLLNNDNLDETEEDDYYRNIKQQQQQQ